MTRDQIQPLPPLLRLIDVTADLDLAFELRRIKRPRRSESSRKGWNTRRASS